MNHTRREPNQKAQRGSSNDPGCQVAAGDGESAFSLLHRDGRRFDLNRSEANSETLASGDILVDVDAGPGGIGLVVWIVGG